MKGWSCRGVSFRYPESAVLAVDSVSLEVPAGACTAVAPTELPVGVVTAFVGVPFFVYLLRRRTA